jgi:hypothetical protein
MAWHALARRIGRFAVVAVHVDADAITNATSS